MWWVELLVACGAAVVGAVTTHLIHARTERRDAARAELVQIRTEVTTAKEQATLTAAQLMALNERVSDVLNRLNAED